MVEVEYEFDCDNNHQDAVSENIVALVKILDKIQDEDLKTEIKDITMQMCSDSFLFGLTFEDKYKETIQ